MNLLEGLAGIRVGDVFEGRFRVESIVANGETELVVSAADLAFGQRVTIRVFASDERVAGLGRWLRQFVGLGLIHSRHFVRWLDHGYLSSGNLYVAFESVDGIDLASWLEQRGRLPIWEAAEVMLQVSEALIEAHAHGLLLRNLTPTSLFVIREPDGEVFIKIMPPRPQLLDVRGLSPATARSEESALLLTLRYAAPELVLGGDVDERCDVWSVGAIFYQLVTGVPPFEAATVSELLASSVTGQRAPIGKSRTDVPEGLEEVTRRSLARDRNERYQSAHELANALRRYAEPDEGHPDEMALHLPRLPRVDEDVQVSVYRPAVIAPKCWLPLLAYVHVGAKRKDDPPDAPDPIQEVDRRARELLGERMSDYRPTTQLGSAGLAEGGQVTLVPEVDGLVFEPPARSFFWRDRVHEAAFDLKLADPARFPSGTVVRGRLTAYAGIVLLADVQLAFTVGEQASEDSTVSRVGAYRKVFVSYSRSDAAIVEQFAAHAEALGDEYLIDVRKLRSGEDWNARLEQFIREADVFQLFWSSTSMRSPFCRREWEYALSVSKNDFVRPVFWEDPMPRDGPNGLPPPDLARIHFARLPRKWLPRRKSPSRPAPGLPHAAPAPAPAPSATPISGYFPTASASEAYAPRAPSRRRPAWPVFLVAAVCTLGVVWSLLMRRAPAPVPPVATYPVPVPLAPSEVPSPTVVTPFPLVPPTTVVRPTASSQPPHVVSPPSTGVQKTCYVDWNSLRISSRPQCARPELTMREEPAARFDAATERALRDMRCTTVISYRCGIQSPF